MIIRKCVFRVFLRYQIFLHLVSQIVDLVLSQHLIISEKIYKDCGQSLLLYQILLCIQ